MTSWRATSMVTTRRPIFTMRSTIGMRKIIPGPYAPNSLQDGKSLRVRTRAGCGSLTEGRSGRARERGLTKRAVLRVLGTWDAFLRFRVSLLKSYPNVRRKSFQDYGGSGREPNEIQHDV